MKPLAKPPKPTYHESKWEKQKAAEVCPHPFKKQTAQETVVLFNDLLSLLFLF